MLRIRRTTDGAVTVLMVSGRLDRENICELHRSLDSLPINEAVVLDLTDLLLADREVIHFLSSVEAGGRAVLRDCPTYIRTWIEAESRASSRRRR